MGRNISVNGSKIKSMERGNTLGLMENAMLVIINLEKDKDMEQ